MNTIYLTMYLGNAFVDQVALNYNGLASDQEKEWYHQGVIQDLCEKHEGLLFGAKQQPAFLIGIYRVRRSA